MNIIDMPVDKEIEIYEPPLKKSKSDYCSDNSVSLPGIVGDMSGIDTAAPIGFEPGMFKQEDDDDVSIVTTTETVETVVQSQPPPNLQQPNQQQKVNKILLILLLAH